MGDLTYPGAAVYMHILRFEDKHRLYVGQPWNLYPRIGQHKSPRFRAAFPSLHYYADDRSTSDCFVVLATLPESPMPSSITQCLLNILEMRCCLIYRTLQKRHLLEYLPKNAYLKDANVHLNVALSLHQSFVEYELNDKQSFEELRFSRDPLILEYYRSMKRCGQVAQKLVISSTVRSQLTYFDGAEVTIVKHKPTRFVIGGLQILLPSHLDLQPGDRVRVKMDVSEGPHLRRYAAESLPEDPASRLGIFMHGKEGDGRPFAH